MTSDRFIYDTLADAGAKLVSRQGEEIAANLETRSGQLLHNRRISVQQNTLTFTHPEYARFIDMRRLSGRRHKRTRIHNRFVYGAYSSIAYRLLHGFAEDAAETFSNKE